jgi:hypothetical protein
MNKRQFNLLLKKITINNRISIEKISTLTNEEKESMVYFIIRNRCPVLKELISHGINQSWLYSMGYMYETKGKSSGYTFIHTNEQTIR